MTEYSRMAKGFFTSTGGAQIINLPFVPDYVELINYTAAATPAQSGIPKAWWDVNMGQGFAVVDLFNATPVLTMDDVQTNGISTFTAGLSLQLGAAQAVSTITKANPAVVTSSSAHGLASGDVVIFYDLIQTATTGMQQICSIPASTTFTIPWNTNQSNFTAYDSGTATTAGYFKKVKYPYLYAPGVNIISAITVGSTTTIDTTSAHNFVVGQEVAFRIPSVWGTTELNSLPNSTIGTLRIFLDCTSVTISKNSSRVPNPPGK